MSAKSQPGLEARRPSVRPRLVPHRFLHSLSAVFLLAASPVRAAQCLVIGDSLTKEYQVEFPALFPTNPASWSARNWAEILHEHRKTWFDLGRFSAFADPRLTGHEHNWAFPGATTTEIRNQLANPLNFWWRMELEGQLEDAVERVVIFAGGNDVDSYYRTLYNGNPATAQLTATRDNLKWIVDYVRGVKASLPIVLVSVPHLGCAPKVQAENPTDPVKTARITAALDTLNSELAAFAANRGIGFVPEVYELTRRMITDPIRIGGAEFYRQADADSRPRYLFSGDGFHPGTSAQAIIAQAITAAFRVWQPLIEPLSDREILNEVLGLDPDLAFQEWMAGQGVAVNRRGLNDDPDGDGLINALEFSLAGGNAALPSPGLLQTQRGQQEWQWSWQPRPEASEWAPLRAELSTDLVNWQAADPALIEQDDDGTHRLRQPASDRLFLRLRPDR
jgi:lysophospholipase L1-like esterase